MYIFRKVLDVGFINTILKNNGVIDHELLKDLHVTVALRDDTKKVDLDKNMIEVKVYSQDYFNGYHVFLIDSDYLQDRFEYYISNGFKWDFDSYKPHISFSKKKQETIFKPFKVLLGPETIKS